MLANNTSVLNIDRCIHPRFEQRTVAKRSRRTRIAFGYSVTGQETVEFAR